MITTHHRYTILAPSLVELRLRLEPIFWDCMTFQTFVIALCEWYIVIVRWYWTIAVWFIYTTYAEWQTAWMGPLLYKICSHSRFLSVYRHDSNIAGLLAFGAASASAAALIVCTPMSIFISGIRLAWWWRAVAVYRAQRNGDHGETRITLCKCTQR